jgi:hypothetical protein
MRLVGQLSNPSVPLKPLLEAVRGESLEPTARGIVPEPIAHRLGNGVLQ